MKKIYTINELKDIENTMSSIDFFNLPSKISKANYKKHFEASAKYEEAKVRMDFLRLEIEQTGSKDLMLEYFECERTLKKSANDKRQASKQSVNLFTYQEIAN